MSNYAAYTPFYTTYCIRFDLLLVPPQVLEKYLEKLKTASTASSATAAPPPPPPGGHFWYHTNPPSQHEDHAFSAKDQLHGVAGGLRQAGAGFSPYYGQMPQGPTVDRV